MYAKGSREPIERAVFTITDVSKQVNGERAVVALDQTFEEDELKEQSLEFLATDQDGNVRYLGSHTEAYEGGKVRRCRGQLAERY